MQKQLLTLPNKRIAEVTVRLAKHKKEVKELLAYLLYDADDEASYIENVKRDIDLHFSEINQSNLYLAKKGLRKILRIVNKQIRFSGKTETETELRIYYLKKLGESGIPISKSQVLINLHAGQVKKIEDAIKKLHEDLQFDYRKQMQALHP